MLDYNVYKGYRSVQHVINYKSKTENIYWIKNTFSLFNIADYNTSYHKCMVIH